MLHRIIGCTVVFWFVVEGGFANEHPLHLAWKMGDLRFTDWRYGSKFEEQQINCVQFLGYVIEELLGRELSIHERDALMIQNIRKVENLQRLVKRGDRRTKGVQYALVSMRRGKVIPPSKARPGDFIQYWYKKEGVWLGHAAIIQEIQRERNKYCAYVFGAHESIDAIGVAGYQITLNDPMLKVYIVRFH